MITYKITYKYLMNDNEVIGTEIMELSYSIITSNDLIRVTNKLSNTLNNKITITKYEVIN